jgi:hypothetical protein
VATAVEPIVITFGGGLSTRKRPADIDLNECVEGQNFDLDPQVLAMQKRAAFDLVDTAPNVGEIRGYAQNIRQDGSITTLIQAGGNVYLWDHAGTFTLVGTTPSSSKLRGPREHNFTLDQYTIITDLNQQDVVKTWDGFTYQTLPHNLTGTFQARYCRVDNERAFYANIKNASSDIPHMLLVSERGDAAVLTVNDRPASTNAMTDPVFMFSPNLKPINGLTEAFGLGVISTKRGRLYEFVGSSAFDFDIVPLYDGSSVSGDEAIVNIGNDVALGMPSRIESLKATEKFGDIASDDLSLPIANLIQNTASWSLAYDRKRKILYCFPDNQSAVYVYNKRIVDSQTFGKDTSQPLSPWAKWTTGLTVNLQPTCVMPLIHPSTFEEVVYFGDANGQIYQFYGTGGTDGGTETFSASRTTKLFRGIPDGKVFEVEGWISYRKQFAATVTLTFLFAGDNVFDKTLTITLPAGDGIAVYNGIGNNAAYYNAGAFYGRSFSERLTRQKFGPPGLEGWFQVKIDVTSEGDVDIQEVGIRFKTAS